MSRFSFFFFNMGVNWCILVFEQRWLRFRATPLMSGDRVARCLSDVAAPLIKRLQIVIDGLLWNALQQFFFFFYTPRSDKDNWGRGKGRGRGGSRGVIAVNNVYSLLQNVKIFVIVNLPTGVIRLPSVKLICTEYAKETLSLPPG